MEQYIWKLQAKINLFPDVKYGFHYVNFHETQIAVASCGTLYTEFHPDQLRNMKIMGINEFIPIHPTFLCCKLLEYQDT